MPHSKEKIHDVKLFAKFVYAIKNSGTEFKPLMKTAMFQQLVDEMCAPAVSRGELDLNKSKRYMYIHVCTYERQLIL